VYFTEPEYIVHGGDITVKFKALQRTIVTSNEPNVTMEEMILDLIRKNEAFTTTEMAENLSVFQISKQTGHNL